MLTRELGIVSFDRGKALPDRLAGPEAERYARTATAMLNVYRLGAGHTRQELHRSIHNLFADEPECPVRRI
ncbi:MAG: hypothetical protein GW802_00535, partial [Armatimonadetes bacterium]|nr:hypothetical protein [Armatimonadota bacterium]